MWATRWTLSYRTLAANDPFIHSGPGHLPTVRSYTGPHVTDWEAFARAFSACCEQHRQADPFYLWLGLRLDLHSPRESGHEALHFRRRQEGTEHDWRCAIVGVIGLRSRSFNRGHSYLTATPLEDSVENREYLA